METFPEEGFELGLDGRLGGSCPVPLGSQKSRTAAVL